MNGTKPIEIKFTEFFKATARKYDESDSSHKRNRKLIEINLLG